MKIDYHFHPNLQAKCPDKRLGRLWDAIREHKIDAIICTEHVYKNAPDAYRRFIQAKPGDIDTCVFPGAELITKEGKGIEVIAFAEHNWYAEHPLLLQPLTLSLDEMIAYLQQSNLYWYIPHPFLIGNPLKKKYATEEAMQAFLASVPGVEMHNGCYLMLEEFYRKLPLALFHTHQAEKFRTSVQLSSVPGDGHAFLAVGSDAHHPRDVGFCLEVEGDASELSRTDLFEFMITNKQFQSVRIPQATFSLMHLLYTGWTTFSEYCMKREWRRYQNQHAAFTTLTTTHPLVPNDTRTRLQKDVVTV